MASTTTGVQVPDLCEAILLVRDPEDGCDEGEAVVDQHRLGRVTVVS